MPTDNDAPVSANLALRVNRTAVVRAVKGMLDGSNLSIKEKPRELIIFMPRHPQRGSIRIEYETGRVQWVRPISSLLGLFDGYESDNGDSGPTVGAEKILSILCADG